MLLHRPCPDAAKQTHGVNHTPSPPADLTALQQPHHGCCIASHRAPCATVLPRLTLPRPHRQVQRKQFELQYASVAAELEEARRLNAELRAAVAVQEAVRENREAVEGMLQAIARLQQGAQQHCSDACTCDAEGAASCWQLQPFQRRVALYIQVGRACEPMRQLVEHCSTGPELRSLEPRWGHRVLITLIQAAVAFLRWHGSLLDGQHAPCSLARANQCCRQPPPGEPPPLVHLLHQSRPAAHLLPACSTKHELRQRMAHSMPMLVANVQSTTLAELMQVGLLEGGPAARAGRGHAPTLAAMPCSCREVPCNCLLQQHPRCHAALQEWAAFCEFATEVTSAVDGGRLGEAEGEERVRPALEYIVRAVNCAGWCCTAHGKAARVAGGCCLRGLDLCRHLQCKPSRPPCKPACTGACRPLQRYLAALCCRPALHALAT